VSLYFGATSKLFHHFKNFIYRHPLTVGDVNYLSDWRVRLGRPEIRVYYIGDIGKVARLLSVAKYGWLFFVQQRIDKAGNNSGVLRPWILTGTEYIEIAQ